VERSHFEACGKVRRDLLKKATSRMSKSGLLVSRMVVMQPQSFPSKANTPRSSCRNP
jgi:hypothetical protein